MVGNRVIIYTSKAGVLIQLLEKNHPYGIQEYYEVRPKSFKYKRTNDLVVATNDSFHETLPKWIVIA
jgi:hypothetical protein